MHGSIDYIHALRDHPLHGASDRAFRNYSRYVIGGTGSGLVEDFRYRGACGPSDAQLESRFEDEELLCSTLPAQRMGARNPEGR